MKRIKPELAVCLSAFVSFCILCGTGALFQAYPLVRPEISVLLSEALAFLPAIFLLIRTSPGTNFEVFRMPKQNHPFETFLFVCFAGAAVTFLSFLLNYLVYFLSFVTDVSLSTTMAAVQGSRGPDAVYLFAAILVPALLEEVYLRGVMQSVLAKELNRTHLILFSGLLFAMLHASMQNFVGPLVAGVFYAWLVCVLGSVWYAVLAHCIHSLLFGAIAWLLEFFSTFGIWSRFPAISLILFLFFLYFALRFAERLTIHRRFMPFPEQKNSSRFLGKLCSNVAMFALLFAFIAKAVFGII